MSTLHIKVWKGLKVCLVSPGQNNTFILKLWASNKLRCQLYWLFNKSYIIYSATITTGRGINPGLLSPCLKLSLKPAYTKGLIALFENASVLAKNVNLEYHGPIWKQKAKKLATCIVHRAHCFVLNCNLSCLKQMFMSKYTFFLYIHFAKSYDKTDIL